MSFLNCVNLSFLQHQNNNLRGALPGSNHIKYKSSDTITVDSVVIDPEYRGYGFGKALMHATYYYLNKNKFPSKYGIKRLNGVTATKSLVDFYGSLQAKIDEAFLWGVHGAEVSYQEGRDKIQSMGMFIEVDDPLLYKQSRDLLKSKEITHNLILSLDDYTQE